MTEEEIMENNKLIAEFMGERPHINTKEEDEFYGEIYKVAFDIQFLKYDHHKVKGKFYERVPLRKLYFHSSRDWLSLVIDKIKSLEKEYPILTDGVLTKFVWESIDSTWLAVVEFIKQYNEYKNNK